MLSQKEWIAFGLIAQNQSLTTIELNKILDLRGNNPTRLWIDRLIGEKLVLSRGKTRGTEYYINPQIIRDSNFKKQPNLKVIEPHRLKELIYEDLSIYPHSSIPALPHIQIAVFMIHDFILLLTHLTAFRVTPSYSVCLRIFGAPAKYLEYLDRETSS